MIGNKLIDKPYSYSGDHYLFQLTQWNRLAAINTQDKHMCDIWVQFET